MVRTDARTFADELRVLERRRRCKTRAARARRQSGGCSRLRALGPPRLRLLRAAISTHRRDTHQLLRSARTAGTSAYCRLNECANWCQPPSSARTCPFSQPAPPPRPAAVPSTRAERPIRTSAERPHPFRAAAQSRPGSVAHLDQWTLGARSQRSLLPGDSRLAPPPLGPRKHQAKPASRGHAPFLERDPRRLQLPRSPRALAAGEDLGKTCLL